MKPLLLSLTDSSSQPALVSAPTALIEEFVNSRIVWGRWNSVFGTWRVPGRAGAADEMIPSWPVLDGAGHAIVDRPDFNTVCDEEDDAYLDYPEWFSDHPYKDDHEAPGDGPEEWREAFTEYVATIPRRVRELAAPFGRLQWPVLRVMWLEPEFRSFLTVELPAVGPGFVAACLILGAAHLTQRAEAARFARRIMTERRADLLSALARIPVTRRLIRLLPKIDVVSLQRDDLLCLLGTLNMDDIARLAAHAPRATYTAVTCMPRIPAWLRTSNLVALLDSQIWKAFNDLLQLPEFEAPSPHLRRRILGSLRGVAGRDALMERMEVWRIGFGTWSRSRLRQSPATPYWYRSARRPRFVAKPTKCGTALRIRSRMCSSVKPTSTVGGVGNEPRWPCGRKMTADGRSASVPGTPTGNFANKRKHTLCVRWQCSCGNLAEGCARTLDPLRGKHDEAVDVGSKNDPMRPGNPFWPGD